jgi:Lon protease-like protein
MQSLPIFACGLALPHMPFSLHVFEPRYRLMVRQVLQSPSRLFGVVLSESSQGPATVYRDIGTTMEILEAKSLLDGRLLVRCQGRERFRVVTRSMLDGYPVASVVDYDDVADEEEVTDEEEDLTVDDYHELGKAFVAALMDELKLAHPALASDFDAYYGTLPTTSDPNVFAYWLASVLPVEDAIKYDRVLACRSLRGRLRHLLELVGEIKARIRDAGVCIVS